ncbi:hypothetical protein [Streptomyces sp. NPDC002746]
MTLPIETSIDPANVQLVTFTGDDAAALLTAAGQWLDDQNGTCLMSVNLVPFYLCPSECEPAEEVPSVRLDLTVDVSARIAST